MISLDDSWAARHPLPLPQGETDKNRRGRVLVAGGSATVPGAPLLTGEAAYRAGAGKVQLAVPEAVAIPLGVRFPEAAVFPLATSTEGELGPEPERLVERIDSCDALILGPGMGSAANPRPLLEAVLESWVGEVALLLDAGILAGARDFEAALARWPGPLVLTPHAGEMAALIGCDPDAVDRAMAREVADRFNATVVLKKAQSWIAAPGAAMLHYAGGGPGLATGGSGDVLAGVIGGLLARGVAPAIAAGWGVRAHGEAGKLLSGRLAPIGFLASELLPIVPGLLYPR